MFCFLPIPFPYPFPFLSFPNSINCIFSLDHCLFSNQYLETFALAIKLSDNFIIPPAILSTTLKLQDLDLRDHVQVSIHGINRLRAFCSTAQHFKQTFVVLQEFRIEAQGESQWMRWMVQGQGLKD